MKIIFIPIFVVVKLYLPFFFLIFWWNILGSGGSKQSLENIKSIKIFCFLYFFKAIYDIFNSRLLLFHYIISWSWYLKFYSVSLLL